MMLLIITIKKNKINNVKKTYYNCNDDITLNKTSNNYYNDTYNITKNDNTYNTTDNICFIKKKHNTSNSTNNITRYNHNIYEHYAIKKVNKHIKHVNNYDTGINYYNKKSLNKNN